MQKLLRGNHQQVGYLLLTDLIIVLFIFQLLLVTSHNHIEAQIDGLPYKYMRPGLHSDFGRNTHGTEIDHIVTLPASQLMYM